MTDIFTDSEEVESGGDSSVITELRKRNRDLEKALKERPSREEVLAQIELEAARRKTAEGALDALGAPAGLASIVVEKVGENLTEESVKEFIEGLGIATQAVNQKDEDKRSVSASDLGRQVASASSASVDLNLAERLANATSKEEVFQLASEHLSSS